MSATRRIRIGIDTGGTFTDVVAVDEETGELVTTKTPSTPANPADGFLNGIDKVLGLLGLEGDAVTAVSHGTTVATNKLLEEKVENLGFITTEGYGHLLEIARQSVPWTGLVSPSTRILPAFTWPIAAAALSTPMSTVPLIRSGSSADAPR